MAPRSVNGAAQIRCFRHTKQVLVDDRPTSAWVESELFAKGQRGRSVNDPMRTFIASKMVCYAEEEWETSKWARLFF